MTNCAGTAVVDTAAAAATAVTAVTAVRAAAAAIAVAVQVYEKRGHAALESGACIVV